MPAKGVIAGILAGTGLSFMQDTALIGRWKAQVGLHDLSGGPYGDLVNSGGAVTNTANVVDGKAAWQFSKSGTARLVTSNSYLAYGPITVIAVLRSTALGGAQASGDTLLGGSGGGLLWCWTATSAWTMFDGAGHSYPVACTAANWNAVAFYSHEVACRGSVNGSAWATPAAGGTAINGLLTVGSRPGNSLPYGGDLAELMIFEGQLSATSAATLYTYLHQEYPSAVTSAAAPAGFSVDQVSLGSITAPFDIWAFAGSANNCNRLSSASATPGANTFQFGNDNNIVALTLTYDNQSNELDRVSGDVSTGGGLATSFANTYVATSGRPILVIPCAQVNSGFAGDVAPVDIASDWSPLAPRGNKLRNSLYGSMWARIKNAIALGGTFRGLHWYAGEYAARGSSSALHATKVKLMLDTLAADLGMPTTALHVLIQNIHDGTAGSSPAFTSTVQAGLSGLAVSGSRITLPKPTGSFEADGFSNNAASCDAIGAAAATAAIGAGWV